MNKIILSIIISFNLAFYFKLYAQEEIPVSDSLNTMSNVQNIHSNLFLNNSATIKQVGNFNEAIINQSGNSGILPNIAEIEQQGNSNFASSSQNGSSNALYIGQFGSDNSADINMTGDYNIAGVLQVGDGNIVQQDLAGDGLHFLTFQYGSDNFIREVQTTQSSIPLQIQQTGNGMKLTIINGNIH